MREYFDGRAPAVEPLRRLGLLPHPDPHRDSKLSLETFDMKLRRLTASLPTCVLACPPALPFAFWHVCVLVQCAVLLLLPLDTRVWPDLNQNYTDSIGGRYQSLKAIQHIYDTIEPGRVSLSQTCICNVIAVLLYNCNISVDFRTSTANNAIPDKSSPTTPIHIGNLHLHIQGVGCISAWVQVFK